MKETKIKAVILNSNNQKSGEMVISAENALKFWTVTDFKKFVKTIAEPSDRIAHTTTVKQLSTYIAGVFKETAEKAITYVKEYNADWVESVKAIINVNLAEIKKIDTVKYYANELEKPYKILKAISPEQLESMQNEIKRTAFSESEPANERKETSTMKKEEITYIKPVCVATQVIGKPYDADELTAPETKLTTEKENATMKAQKATTKKAEQKQDNSKFLVGKYYLCRNSLYHITSRTKCFVDYDVTYYYSNGEKCGNATREHKKVYPATYGNAEAVGKTAWGAADVTSDCSHFATLRAAERYIRYNPVASEIKHNCCEIDSAIRKIRNAVDSNEKMAETLKKAGYSFEKPEWYDIGKAIIEFLDGKQTEEPEQTAEVETAETVETAAEEKAEQAETKLTAEPKQTAEKPEIKTESKPETKTEKKTAKTTEKNPETKEPKKWTAIYTNKPAEQFEVGCVYHTNIGDVRITERTETTVKFAVCDGRTSKEFERTVQYNHYENSEEIKLNKAGVKAIAKNKVAEPKKTESAPEIKASKPETKKENKFEVGKCYFYDWQVYSRTAKTVTLKNIFDGTTKRHKVTKVGDCEQITLADGVKMRALATMAKTLQENLTEFIRVTENIMKNPNYRDSSDEDGKLEQAKKMLKDIQTFKSIGIPTKKAA